MKGVEKTLGMHLNVLEGKKNHRLAVIQDQKLLLSLSSKRGKPSVRAHIIAVHLVWYFPLQY